MKRFIASTTVLVLLIACGDFGTDTPENNNVTPSIDGGAGTDAGPSSVTEAGTDAGTCPPNALLCESFDTPLDPVKWSKYVDSDLAVSTKSTDSRASVLVSEVRSVPSDDQGARVIYDLHSEKPFVFEVDMKVDEPVRNSGGTADNFSVLSFGTDNILVVFYVKKDGLIQFNSTFKDQGGNGYTPHSIGSPHVTWGQWEHYVIKASLGKDTSLELTRDKEVLASGAVNTAGQLNEFISLGVSRNNDFYDLHVEYDNVVVYPQ